MTRKAKNIRFAEHYKNTFGNVQLKIIKAPKCDFRFYVLRLAFDSEKVFDCENYVSYLCVFQ